MILQAFREAGRALDAGELVCVFPEGQLTRTGMMAPFQRGLQRIVKGRTTPIIPIHLDRLMGSIFAPASHRRLPERIPYPVTVSIGRPMPPESSLFELRQAISELGQQAWSYRKRDRRPLHHEFIRRARRHPSRLAFADLQTPRVSYFKALAGALALARALRTALGGPGGRRAPAADERGRLAGQPGRGDGRPRRRQPELHRGPGRDGVRGGAGGAPHGRHQPGLPREGEAPAARRDSS